MQYMMITLELIQNRPELCAKLRAEKTMLTTVECYAKELKASHEAWKKRLEAEHPSTREQIDAEALELALQEIRDRLLSASTPSGEEALSLDEAMAFLRKATPSA
jgi:hypothetical protein